jgi:hypothetical protein
MADTKHLLYLLPDVAYAVELVPSQDGAYAIRDYLQVNGDFMNENELIEANLKKLVGKLQPQAYDLILPDFLFTNTVVNVDKTGAEEVKKYLQAELIPSLEISEQTHAVQTFVLTELKGSSKAQLSALELSVMEPLRATFTEGASIRNIHPLSWTLKSLISLEPSISLVQMGARLYLAQHYIGVDQAVDASAEDAEKLIETVKTLKGAEPNIQTLYLLSSALVEKKLRDGLKDTLPLQQLASDGEESEMPSYVKQVVEAGAKTLSVADYKIPVFTISVGKMPVATAPSAADKKEAMADKPDSNQKPEKSADTALPTPTEVGGDDTQLEFADADAKETSPETEKVEETPTLLEKPEEVDLSQFSSKEDEPTPEVATEPLTKKEPTATAQQAEPAKPTTSSPTPAKRVIKNERGTNSMVRMIFIGLASFFVTVGIGLGIGLGLLTFTNPDETTEPTPSAEVTPAPEATPTPTPAPEINRADYDVRVVNATTKAGYAGEIAGLLEEAGFEEVVSGNALGDYEPGNYVLLEEEDEALVDLLGEDTGLDLEYAAGKEIEDSAGAYTIIIVLAE